MADIFDQIAAEAVGSAGSAPVGGGGDFFDQIAMEAVGSQSATPTNPLIAAGWTPIESRRDASIGALKGIAKAGTDIVTAPADLLFRGGNKLIDWATGSDTDLTGQYPSDIRDQLLELVSGGEGDETSEAITRGVGNIGTVVAVPSQAASIASKVPFLGKASQTSTLANLLSKTIGYSTEGAAYGALFNAKDENIGEKAATGAALNVAIPAAFKLGGKLLRGLSNRFAGAADETLERGMGVQYGDRTKGLNRVNLYVDDAGNVVPFDKIDDAVGVQAPIQQQIKTLESAGILKNAPNDAQGLKVHITKEAGKVGNTIPGLVNKADEVIGKNEILPEFEATNRFLAGYRPQTRSALTQDFNRIVDDYINSPGAGLKKLTKFTDQLQKETGFDSAIPAQLTQLKRMIQYDLRKAAEREFDLAVPAMAGKFKEANDIYSAAQAIGKTLNKPLARKMPEFGDYITGGSLPMTVMTGALSAPLGLTPAATISGARLIKNAAQQYSEAAYPITMSNLYRGLSAKSGSAAQGVEALGRGAPAGVKAIVGLLAQNESGEPENSTLPEPQSAPLQQARSPQLGLTDLLGRTLGNQAALQPFDQELSAAPAAGLRSPQRSAPLQASAQGSALTGAASISSVNPTALDSANQPSSTSELSAALKILKPKGAVIPASVKREIAEDPYLHALALTESSMDPSAKNPKSSAKGLFQFVDSTAKAIGLSNALDPAESLAAVKKLISQIDKIAKGDPALRYAGHYLGETLLRKVLDGKKLTAKEAEIVESFKAEALPNFQRNFEQVSA